MPRSPLVCIRFPDNPLRFLLSAPPLSDEQVEAIAAIIAGGARSDPAELDTWRLTLTCDHVIDKSQHASNSYWCASTTHCPVCGRIRGIVISERLPPTPRAQAVEHRRLVADLDQARRECERFQKKADAARRRIDKLEAELIELGPVTAS